MHFILPKNTRFIRLACTALCLTALAPAIRADTEILAFPGAEGFGALVTGGRGGEVVRVTNLNDRGPGSLRDAIGQPHRVVVFDVAGLIQIESALVFSNNITLAGQSAPGPVVVYGHAVSLSDRDNVIVRYITFRQGLDSPRGSKALNITRGHNMIFDHVTAGWGRWDNLGVTSNSTNLTFQHCMFPEAIDPQRFGALVDSSRRLSFIGNLWVNNHSRNPKGKADMQYINNVVYNWGAHGYGGGHSGAVWNQDLIHNVFIAGPSSNVYNMLHGFTETDHLFATDNLLDLNLDGQLNGRLAVESDYLGWRDPEAAPTFNPTPFNHPPVPVTIFSPEEAFHRSVAWAGNSLHRDTHELRVIEQVRSLGTEGKVIHHEAEVGGVGDIPSTRIDFERPADGIPPEWKRQHGLDPADDSIGLTLHEESGYMWVEVYLNSLAPLAPTIANR
jgi:pectate lyase